MGHATETGKKERSDKSGRESCTKLGKARLLERGFLDYQKFGPCIYVYKTKKGGFRFCCVPDRKVSREYRRSSCIHTKTHESNLYKDNLVKTAASQIICDNDVGDCVKHELDIGGIRGAGHVAIDFLIRGLVFRFELSLDIRRCLVVVLAT